VGEVVLAVGAEVLAVPLAAKENVPVLQDDDDSGSSDDEGSDSDDEDTAVRILSSVTPSGIIWFKWPIFLGVEYDCLDKVILHTFDIVNKNVGASYVVKQHRLVLPMDVVRSYLLS
jgi:hypothetical protein